MDTSEKEMLNGLTCKQYELFGAIQLFLDSLYSLSNFSPSINRYRTFCANANAVSNPNMKDHVKQVIEDFHVYFYKEQNVKYMNSGSFEEIGPSYGNEDYYFPIRDVLKLLTDTGKHTCIRHIALYVFSSYQGSKDALGLFTYFKDTDENLTRYYGC